MIRANLLPRPKEAVSVFGLRLDAEYLRQTALGVAIVVAVALLGITLERFHLRALEAQAADLERGMAVDAPQRSEAKFLANDVAHYQEFARQALLFRRSGADAAVAVAEIGNRVPEGVWLDGMSRAGAGYDLSGGARSIDAVSGAVLALGYALPDNEATLVNLENKPSDGIAFSARVAASASAASPAADIVPNAIASRADR